MKGVVCWAVYVYLPVCEYTSAGSNEGNVKGRICAVMGEIGRVELGYVYVGVVCGALYVSLSVCDHA